MLRTVILGSVAALALGLAAEAAAPRMAPATPGTVDVVTDDRVVISTQPGPADFDRWKAAGVTTIVNTRSREENVPAFRPRR